MVVKIGIIRVYDTQCIQQNMWINENFFSQNKRRNFWISKNNICLKQPHQSRINFFFGLKKTNLDKKNQKFKIIALFLKRFQINQNRFGIGSFWRHLSEFLRIFKRRKQQFVIVPFRLGCIMDWCILDIVVRWHRSGCMWWWWCRVRVSLWRRCMSKWRGFRLRSW